MDFFLTPVRDDFSANFRGEIFFPLWSIFHRQAKECDCGTNHKARNVRQALCRLLLGNNNCRRGAGGITLSVIAERH